MKLIQIIITLLFCTFANAQSDFTLTTEVRKDSIFIKCIPKNVKKLYEIWEKGAEIELVVDQDSKETWKLDPINIHREKFSQEKFEKELALIDQLIEARSIGEKDQNFAFALFMIESSISYKMNLVNGLMIALPNNFRSEIQVTLKINGIPKSTLQIDPKTKTKYKEIEEAKISLDKKRTVNLEWNSNSLNDAYLGYLIERKIADSAFRSLTKEPYINITSSTEKKERWTSYRDEKIKQGVKYVYRITAVNYFGKPAGKSKEFEIYIPMLVMADISINKIESDGNIRKLTVEIQGMNKGENLQIDELILLRSESLKDGYTEIPFKQNKINDSLLMFLTNSEVESGDAYYYKVCALSKDKDSVLSTANYFFTLDQSPPEPVSNLTGKIDSLGFATITWETPKDKDIRGYKLFRANGLQEEFQLKNEKFAVNNGYTDTLSLNSLTNEIYYFVIAVDNNFNNSISSDTIRLLKPDTISPLAAIITDLNLEKNGISVIWSNATNIDKVQQYLFRKSENRLDSIVLSENQNSFYDSLVTYGASNSYYIKTIDESLNTSISNNPSLLFEPGFRPAIETFSAKLNKEQKAITLSWESPKSEIFAYSIYRKKDEGKLRLLKTIEAPLATEFIDTDCVISTNYEYVIQYQLKSGVRSLMSTPAKVRM